jgi:hypothetical protein
MVNTYTTDLRHVLNPDGWRAEDATLQRTAAGCEPADAWSACDIG